MSPYTLREDWLMAAM